MRRTLACAMELSALWLIAGVCLAQPAQLASGDEEAERTLDSAILDPRPGATPYTAMDELVWERDHGWVYLPLDQTDNRCLRSTTKGNYDADGEGPWVPFCTLSPARVAARQQGLFAQCCEGPWTNECIAKTWQYSSCSCGQQNLCATSGPQSPACPVVSYICSFDPYCCRTSWDFVCALETWWNTGGLCVF